MILKRHFLIPMMLVLVFGVIISACGEDAATTASTAPASTSQPTSPSETTAATAPPSSEQPTQTLKIGVSSAQTGMLSSWMLVANDAINRYADFVNENGGITVQGQNYNIEIVFADTQSSVEGSAAAANKLVFDEKIKFVIGGASFENAALNPILEQNKVMHLTMGQSPHPDLASPQTPYTFMGFTTIAGQGGAMLTALHKEFPEAKTVVFCTNDDGNQDIYAKALAGPAAKLGFTVLNDGKAIVYAPSIEDMTPVASQVNSMKPDAVMTILTTTPALGSLCQSLRALGSTIPLVCQALPADVGDFVTAMGGPAATNIISLAVLRDDPNSPPKWKAFDAVIPDGPIDFTLAAMLDILLQVIEKADSLEVDDVVAAWESTDSMEGLLGTTNFGGEETYGLKGHVLTGQVQYIKIMDGESVQLANHWLAFDPVP